MAATLKDVAQLAGVSVKTVSNVVHGYTFVKAVNRRRVEEALAATGYRPNLGARNLRRGRTGFIGLMVPELSVQYFAELAGRFITAAHEHDWNVRIAETQGRRERERSMLASLGPHLIDGLVISPEAIASEDLPPLGLGVPMVMLGEHAIDVAIDHVAIDNVLAARTAVEHLISLGRRRIAAIGENQHRGTAALRLAGYRAALVDAGLPYSAELVAPVAAFHRRDGAEAMASLLDRPDPPDAVFCFNDLLAVGALRTAVERGLRVPADVAIVGFDGTEESAYSLPSLTTIAPDKSAIARAALDLLQHRIGDGQRSPTNVQTPFVLEIRGSSAGSARAVAV